MRYWLPLAMLAVILRLKSAWAALWYDEAFSALVAQLPLDRLLAAAAADVHPPTYYLLLATIGRLVGYSEFVLRLPSLLASVALLPVVWRLAGCLRANTVTRWLAVGLAAFSPFQIHYASEARSYALLTLAVALAALGLLERRYWLAVAGSLAALYLHNTAALFLAPLWLISLRNERRYWLAGVAVAVGYIPGLWWALAQAGHVTGNFWIPPLTSPGRLLATLDDLFWYGSQSPYVFAAGLVSVVVLALLVMDSPRLAKDDAGRFLLVMVMGPLLLLALASIIWQPILISRVMAPAAPFYCILLALVLNTPRRRWVVGAMAAPVLLALLIYPHRTPRNPELQQHLAGVDAIYHANVSSYLLWAYYLPTTPQFMWPQPDGLNATLSRETRQALGLQEIEFDLIKCATLETKPARRWAFLYAHNPTTGPAEIEYVASTIQRHHATEKQTIRQDSLTAAGLVEITPECDHAAISNRNH